MRTALWILLAASAAAAAPFDNAVKNVRRRAAYRFVRLAQDAEDAELARTAAAIRRRVLQLLPKHVLTLRKLGYKRSPNGVWRQPPEARKALAAAKDADAKLGLQYKREIDLAEEQFLRELVAAAVRLGTPAQKRALLLPYLRRMPRSAMLHEALGHKRVGPDHVRPELLPLVGRLHTTVAAWRACARQEVGVTKVDDGYTLPGFAAPLPCFAVGGRWIVGTQAPPQVEEIARAVGRTRAFLTLTLGKHAGRWDPSPFVFLNADAYKQLVAHLHPDKKEFALYHRYANYESAKFYAVRAFSIANASERYAHGTGFRLMWELAAPDKKGGGRDTWAYAWLCEGYGYAASLELFDAGYLSYASLTESSGKRAQTRPPPPKRTRASCLAWTREQHLAGYGLPLRDLLGRSLNNLDFGASMDAYVFVRFLMLLDPAAFRRLPHALRAESGGAPVDRADRVIRKLYGRGIAELEPLWRAFLLEITQ